jgi:3-hydroxyacyl-CoA dehydrogenase
MTISQSREQRIQVIRIAYPPMNILSIGGGVVQSLTDAVRAAVADPDIAGIVLAGAGKLFSAGADIGDFDGDPAALGAMRVLMDMVEGAPKPVVAAIHGMALGGGHELALACHYRVATADARLGFPEVSLGLLPGAGGTQRLPRLIAPEAAIAMMRSGRPVAAAKAPEGLVDRIVEGDPVAAAVAFLRDEAPAADPVGRRAARPGLAEAVAGARADLDPKARNRAPADILDCVEAAGSDLRAGLALEAARFDALMASEASLGLRHAFFGQRKVARIPGLSNDITPRAIGTVAVVGGGLMGTGIATALLAAGLRVTLIEPQEAARARAEAAIGKTFARDVEKSRLRPDQREERLARLTMADTLEAAAGADLAIEAVFEDMGVKEQVFRTLDRVTGPDAILASNTSTLDLDAIAAFTDRPQQVVGLHFFSPANIMKLLEIVRGAQTAPAVLATAMAFAKRIGKVGVVAGVCDGFIGNRIFEEYLRAAYVLAEEGAMPQQIDAAMEGWGMAMGPFRTMDLAGQDIGWSIRKRRAVEHPDRPYSTFPDRICELGRFGQKVGKGVYLYADGRTATVDPVIDALLLAHSAERGIARHPIADDAIVDRLLLAMINEGARIVAEGIAYRPVDVDIIYLNGYGFPADRGGPMFVADRMGLPRVLAKLEALAAREDGWAWAPAPLIRRLAGEGRCFEDLNR